MKHAALWISLFVVASAACGVALAAESGLLVRVERRADDDLKILRAADLPVVMELDSCLFLEGTAGDVAWLRDHGYEADILDSDAAHWDYLVLGLRPDSDRTAIDAAGTVLLTESNWLLVRVPPRTTLNTLDAAKVFVGRLSHAPAEAPKEQPSLVRRPPGHAAAALTADPLVQKIVNALSTTQIDQTWSSLTTNPPNGTRYSPSQGCADAGTLCYNKYVGYGLTAEYQEWSSTYKPNVVGTKAGAVNPGNVFIVIGHLDDLPASGAAPGANDNASGTVIPLEAARVMSCYAFRNTVKYINCTGEEQGLLGSEAYAADAESRGENILGVINVDEAGWQGDGTPVPENLDLNYNAASADLGLRFAQAAAAYGTGLTVDAFLCPSLNASDHYPFWTHGWKAICGITDNEGYCGHVGSYPYYHTSSDTIANCGDKTFYHSVVRASVATLAELAEPFKVTFDKTTYACNATSVQLYVGDRDLNTNPAAVETVTVTVSSAAEPTPETFVLTETGADSMIFTGAIPTTTGPAIHGDGLLSVSPTGDTITATYVDALDCDGSANVIYQATTQIDCTAPVITNVEAVDVTGDSAVVAWTTDEPATSVVHYGTTPPGAGVESSTALVTGHNVALAGLAQCSAYSFWVASVDAAGNGASDDNHGAYYSFQTLKNTNPGYASTDTPVGIPDEDATGATSTITVTDTNTVLDVNVAVNIAYYYDGDLTLYLITPTGATITLANRRGAAGADFTNTVFDDEASGPIGAATAPFTGSFRPDTPLSAADGISAAGQWKLKVVDPYFAMDTGTIVNWTLTLTYPTGPCGGHAVYSSHAALADTCSGGGAGDHNETWDAGENVQFSVTLFNDGTTPLTHLSASVTPTTAGVVMLTGVSGYANLPSNSYGTSIAPHFTARLPKTLACGAAVGFQVTIASDQGTWTGAFAHTLGSTSSPSGVALNETFAAGIPSTWTVVDGGTGGGVAAAWTTANPGHRTFMAPMADPVAMVDSDVAGGSATQDEQLITPVLNLSTALTVTLDFDQYFYYYSGSLSEIGDVDVRSSLTGGAWVNRVRNQGASTPNPDHRTIDISAQAAGAADVQLRFHYYNASWEWYWEVDNVKVSYTAPPACLMSTCLTSTTAPPPVPDGSFGTPMTASLQAPGGSSIEVHWDVSTCTAADYHLLYGPLASLSAYGISGAACDLGTAGAYAWSAVPDGNLWFVVAADDDANTEGSWGVASSGAQRGGATPSGQCGMTRRDNSGACP